MIATIIRWAIYAFAVIGVFATLAIALLVFLAWFSAEIERRDLDGSFDGDPSAFDLGDRP